MPRRPITLSLLLSLFLLSLSSVAPPPLARPAPEAPPGGPVVPPGPALPSSATDGPRSAVVALAGPGVLARWRSAGAPALGADARTVAKAAASDRKTLRRMLVAVESEVSSLADQIEGLGGRVVGRYHVSAAGLRVHATARQLEAVARLPEVAYVERGPQVRPLLSRSAPAVGAETVAGVYGWDGQGSVIAIIDTGIDYTHAALGGPGTPAAYAAAASAAEQIDDVWEGSRLFPNARVIGGYDFAGPNYTSPAHCPPAEERAGRCTSTPHPDDDPLDAHGHGTHVAAIAAGDGGGEVAPGVARGAKLVALKLYGPPAGGVFADESVDGLIDAIEWLAATNLGLEERGVVPGHVDVANISLGEPWAQGSQLFDAAVEAATDAGVTIVASAGNDRNVPYIHNAPASSPRVLAVAGTTSPASEPAMWVDVGRRFRLPVVPAVGAPSLDVVGAISASAIRVGSGCPGDDLQRARDLVAVVEMGECSVLDKVLALQEVGARAVVMLEESDPAMLGADPSVVTLPVLGLRSVHAAELRSVLSRTDPGSEVQRVLLELDGRLRVTDPVTGASLAGFSARGPARSGALKPDLAAPGASVSSAARAGGGGSRRISGTSMSAPHVAGAAAILRQAMRARGGSLGALDLAALLMASARPDISIGEVPAPVARQGAGRLDLLRAVGAPVLVRSGAVASLDLGAPALTAPRRITRSIQIRNLGEDALDLAIRARPRVANARGLVVDTGAAEHEVAPGADLALEIGFAFDPAELEPWPFRPSESTFTIEPGEMNDLVRDGWLEVYDAQALADAEEGGAPPPPPLASLPYRALPRAASAVRLSWSPSLLQSSNEGAIAGRAELFETQVADPDEPELRHELDLARFGARLIRLAAGEGSPDTLELAFVRHETAILAHTTVLAAYLDVDADGVVDWRVSAGPEAAITGSGSERRMGVAAVRWDADTDTPAGAARAISRWPAQLHERVTTFAVPLATFGEEVGGTIALYGAGFGLDETWWDAPAIDWLPGGDATGEGGGEGAPSPEKWLRLVRGRNAQVPVLGERPPGDRSVAIVPAVCRSSAQDAPGTVLALMPDNPADPVDGEPGQWMLLTGADTWLPGVSVPELPQRDTLPCRTWLPWGRR